MVRVSVGPLWSNEVRPRLARSAQVRRIYEIARYDAPRWKFLKPGRAFSKVSAGAAVRMAYNVMFDREPDRAALQDFKMRVANGTLSRSDMVGELRGSSEFENYRRMRTLGPSVHAGRIRFVRSLPRAERILDLGGTDLGSENGALVELGYPYPFQRLTIVDLPPDERHPLYRGDAYLDEVVTALGPVNYLYHSMTDLSAFHDASFDLVYSGQSIEHITEAEGDSVFLQVFRLLRPGGWFAIDTPNGRVTRLHQEEFIDPDHKIEYTLEQLLDKAKRAGFEVQEARGLNYAGNSVSQGYFSEAEAAGNHGLYSEATDCYILALILRRPQP